MFCIYLLGLFLYSRLLFIYPSIHSFIYLMGSFLVVHRLWHINTKNLHLWMDCFIQCTLSFYYILEAETLKKSLLTERVWILVTCLPLNLGLYTIPLNELLPMRKITLTNQHANLFPIFYTCWGLTLTKGILFCYLYDGIIFLQSFQVRSWQSLCLDDGHEHGIVYNVTSWSSFLPSTVNHFN